MLRQHFHGVISAQRGVGNGGQLVFGVVKRRANQLGGVRAMQKAVDKLFLTGADLSCVLAPLIPAGGAFAVSSLLACLQACAVVWTCSLWRGRLRRCGQQSCLKLPVLKRSAQKRKSPQKRGLVLSAWLWT